MTQECLQMTNLSLGGQVQHYKLPKYWTLLDKINHQMQIDLKTTHGAITMTIKHDSFYGAIKRKVILWTIMNLLSG